MVTLPIGFQVKREWRRFDYSSYSEFAEWWWCRPIDVTWMAQRFERLVEYYGWGGHLGYGVPNRDTILLNIVYSRRGELR